MMKLTRITPVLFFLAIAMTTPVDVGFVLDGGHVNVTCDACHVSGTFGPTQSSCASCHSNTGLVRASGKPTDHVQTEGECSDCHITATWSVVTYMDHSGVTGSLLFLPQRRAGDGQDTESHSYNRPLRGLSQHDRLVARRIRPRRHRRQLRQLS
jgi:hypothetical protein